MNYAYYNNSSDIEKYNAPVLVFFCRDRNLEFHSVFICDKENLSPEMYIEKGEKFIAEEQELITNIKEAPNSNYGEETVVCHTTFPWQVKKLRKSFTHTYLADVKWEKMCVEKMGLRTPYISVPDDYNEKWLTIKDIKELEEEKHFYVPIRWIAWDIETNAEPIFPNFNGYKDAEKCEIISIAAYDNYRKCYYRFCWHPTVKSSMVSVRDWERKGEYYIPALKKTRKYDKINNVITHTFANEIEMLKAYFNWFTEVKPDAQYGFHSEGGYRVSTKRGYSRRYWNNGFDILFLYHRSKVLGLLKEIQSLSPLPNHIKAVRFRSHGDKQSVTIDGVTQIDFIYTNEIFMYHKKFPDFREGNLEGFMSYFLGFGKVKHDEQVFEMWRDNLTSDYDPSKPEEYGVEKKRNLVKEMFESGE